MTRTKRFLGQLEVGDFVTTGGAVYEVTKVLKTQLVVKPYGQINAKGTDGTGERRVTKKTGKLVGGYNTHFRTLWEDETPDGILEAFQAKKDEKQAARKEKDRKWEEKLVTVYQANNELEFEHIGLDLQKTTFVNKAGEKGILIFKTTPDSTYDYEKMEEIPAFRISSVVYSSRWIGEGRSFGMPNDVVATRTMDGIITLIAGSYWD